MRCSFRLHIYPPFASCQYSYLFYLLTLSTSAFSVSICGSLKCRKNRTSPILLSSLSLHFALLHNQQRNELHFLIFFPDILFSCLKKIRPAFTGRNKLFPVSLCLPSGRYIYLHFIKFRAVFI